MKINLLAFSADRQLLTSLEVITFNGITLTTTPAGTSSELRALTQQQRFDAALIDAADGHLPVVQTILNLTAQQPGIKILLLVSRTKPCRLKISLMIDCCLDPSALSNSSVH